MLMSTLWGIFGATWFLFALEELDVSPALVGVIAGIGGVSSFIGAVVATRATTRWGVGPVAIGSMVVAAIGNLFIPLAPAGAPLLAVLFLSGQQVFGDSAVTVSSSWSPPTCSARSMVVVLPTSSLTSRRDTRLKPVSSTVSS